MRSPAILRSVEGGSHAGSDLTDREDRELLSAMARREDDALRELYRRYGSAVFALAVRITRDRAFAEDVIQEVFIAAWDRATSFDETRGSVRAWLLTRAHHRSVDRVRGETATRRRNLVLTLDDPDREPAAPDRIVEDDWISRRRDEVRAALEHLSAEQQEVLELAYFGGFTQREIAGRVGVPLGTVKSRTITALRTLRARLSAGEEEG
jgi:RNA polymerase sigma-70 factor (ECF subfamily)